MLRDPLAVARRTDLKELADEFAAVRHIEIRGFLSGGGADGLAGHLEGRLDWVSQKRIILLPAGESV